jgi:phosphate transport system substrate-binding protein
MEERVFSHELERRRASVRLGISRRLRRHLKSREAARPPLTHVFPAAIVAVVLAFAFAACGGDDNSGNGNGNLSGTISIDGSSTVGPLTEIAAELFREENRDVRITVGVSGTGGGFEKFCAGETDISDASRSIEAEEKKTCSDGGVRYEEVQVANDGLAIVVNRDNDFATCLSTDELKKIWDKGSDVDNWNQVRSDFPDTAMKLFGPGTDSGTFDYFTEQINGEEGRSRSDYSPSEDDNVTVQGVSGAKGNLGYFGLSYAVANEDKVTTLEVDGGDGCVKPANETVQDGSYKPLSRPLFMYPSDEALRRPEVKAFVDFYVENQDQIAEQAQFVPMTDEQAQKSSDKLAELAGT